MDLKEVWIGESLKVLSSGRIGKFEGIAKDGRARVSSSGKIFLVKATNLEKYIEPPIDKIKAIRDELEGRKVSIDAQLNFNTSLDLHIDKLSPSLGNSAPEHILQFQLKSCQEFLVKAIELKMANIIIIHGRGTGVLRSEVLELIKSFEEVSFTETINNGGAQRVIFK